MLTTELLETQPELSLVEILLAEQQQLSAVEKFSQWHSKGQHPTEKEYYQELIPAEAPGPGQQYAFEVDLDSCSGCKACVAACHNLNGLEEDEIWRNVGLLQGGSNELPVLQHVTSSCHHCVEPACLQGCPVEAYEKDLTTGIVKHLDDQCIGCKYCIWKCPYDVPQYSKSKGIVRKCDMCSDRLKEGEPPACVQSCPTQSIRITTVNHHDIVEQSESNLFLPSAPDPSYTLPTTNYKSSSPLPRNLLPTDYYSARAQHAHLSLVFMLVLTQMSVGAFIVEQFLATSLSWFRSEMMMPVRSVHLAASLLLGISGLVAAVFHLGRPWLAYRAIIGLRRSWLSREILAFSLFAFAATIYAGSACLNLLGYSISESTYNAVGVTAAAMGILALICSVMIYVDTRRPYWNGVSTTLKFFGTALVLGIPTALLFSLIAPFVSSLEVEQLMQQYGKMLCKMLMVATISKLIFECLILTHLNAKQHTPLKRTALLLTGELSLTSIKRLFFGVIGGLILPGILIAEPHLANQGEYHPIFVAIIVTLSLITLLVGELIERYLFFSASVAQKMPGTN